MMQKLKLILFPLLLFLGILVYLLISGEAQSAEIREKVVRFHVVANSDSKEDQKIKLLVRDRLFASIESLFADCEEGEDALAVARAHQDVLEQEGNRILKELCREERVSVTIGKRFFPTKTYGSLSFPAGHYQAVSVLIGEGEGENFWCVLYPALCVSPSVCDEESEEKMILAVGEEETAFLQRNGQITKMKFFLVEWFENLMKKFTNS